MQFSIQLANDDSQIQDVDIWLRKNGSDVAGSNSKFSIDSKHGSVKGHVIAALNFNIELAKNDYVEIVWRTENTGVSIEHFGTSAMSLTWRGCRPNASYRCLKRATRPRPE